MFEMSAFFKYNEVQTSFLVFGNSLESIFAYDSDCFSNFWLQFINSIWRTPVLNIFYVSAEIVVTESHVWGARRPWNRSASSHPSSRKLSVQIFTYFFVIVKGAPSCWNVMLSGQSRSLGSKKYRTILLYLLPVTFPPSKNKARLSPF